MANYPSRTDIVTAVRNPVVSFKAEELIGGSVIYSGSRIIQYSGGYTTVFPFHTKGARKIALRCWIADIGDAKKRSIEISHHLAELGSSYFAPFEYVDEGLIINGSIYPIVIMDWIDAKPLKEFISRNYNNLPKCLDALAENFRTMVAYFHEHDIAHGDLQHGNILVKDDGSILVVDYDSMFVASLGGMADTIKGLPGYQHPARKSNETISKKLDYFSELVIYLSLRVFEKEPHLWLEYVDTEDLLFSSADFLQPGDSVLLNRLLKSSDDRIRDLTRNLLDALEIKSIDDLSPLEDQLVSKIKKTIVQIENKWNQQPNPSVAKPIILPNPFDITSKF